MSHDQMSVKIRLQTIAAIIFVASFLNGMGAAHASTDAQLTAEDLLRRLNILTFADFGRQSVSIQGIPSATVVPSRSYFLSLTGSNTRPTGFNDADGDMSFGLGFGDQDTGIGGHIGVANLSLKDNFFDSGYFFARVGTRVLPQLGLNYIAVGLDNLVPWGPEAGHSNRVRIMASRFSSLTFGPNDMQHPLMMTVGISTGDARDSKLGVFAGIGLGVTDGFSVSVSRAGNRTNAGIGYVPPNRSDINVTFTASDLTATEAPLRLSVSVSWRVGTTVIGVVE